MLRGVEPPTRPGGGGHGAGCPLLFSRSHPGLGQPGLELSTPIDEDSVFAPDLWWTTPEHTPDLDTNRHAGPPDLVIEVGDGGALTTPIVPGLEFQVTALFDR